MIESSFHSDFRRVLDRANRIVRFKGVSVRIGARATTGQLYRVKEGGWVTKSRTAGDNVIALRANAKKGRSIATLSRQQRSLLRYDLQRALGRFAHSAAESAEVLLEDILKLGRTIIEAYVHNIKTGANADGQLRPVKPGTQRRKDRETKTTGRPPMWRSGQLMESFVATLKDL